MKTLVEIRGINDVCTAKNKQKHHGFIMLVKTRRPARLSYWPNAVPAGICCGNRKIKGREWEHRIQRAKLGPQDKIL
jgi:hypothetical protein